MIDWFRANRLSLNLSKTNYVLFKPRNIKIQGPSEEDDCLLTFGSDKIEGKPQVKFLGLWLDESLSWYSQYQHLNSKLSRAVYVLNKVKHFLPYTSMKTLYFSLFHSHLSYGLMLWGTNLITKFKNNIFKKQKKVIRIMHKARYNDHTHELFLKSGILKLDDLIDLDILKIMYLNSTNHLPIPIQKLFPRNTNCYNTRQCSNPRILKASYKPMSKSFLSRGPLLWHSLHKDIKNSKSIKSFNKALKKSIFKSRY